MAGSILTAVRAALAAALKAEIQATAGMSAVYVEFQHPTGDADPSERVWTQNGSPQFTPAAMKSGRNFLNETATFDVVVRTARPNRTALEAATRAAEIAQVVIEWVGDNKSGEALAVPGLQTLTVDGAGTQVETLADSGVAGSFQIPIKYTARLT